jgi:hypothetical protein
MKSYWAAPNPSRTLSVGIYTAIKFGTMLCGLNMSRVFSIYFLFRKIKKIKNLYSRLYFLKEKT